MKLSAAYLAGLFDGEGSVQITNRLAIRIRISNTYEPIIRRLRKQFGAYVNVVDPGRRKKPHWKVGYVWQASGHVARNFLKLIGPYAVIKAKQIAIALQVVPHIRGVKIQGKEAAQRKVLRHKLQLLNKRGSRWCDVKKWNKVK